MMLLLSVVGLARGQNVLFSEGFEGGTMPDGWTTDGPGTWSVGSGDYSTSTGAGNGTYNALIKHGTTGNATKLVTPEIDLSSVTSAELSFMHIQRSWSGDFDDLKVYYRSASNEDWTLIAEYTAAVASWTTEEGIVLPNLSSTYQIAFEMTDNYGYGVGVDNVIIIQSAPCPKPTDLAVDNVDANSATLSWTSPAANVTGYAYQYKKESENDWSAEVSVNNLSVTLSGLTPATRYNFRVKAICNEGESTFSTISFLTDCAISSTYPWSTNFDSDAGTSSGSTNNLPPCWNYLFTCSNSSYQGYPVIYNSSSHSASNCLRFYSSASSSPEDQYAILPEMESLAGKMITFYARGYNSGNSIKVGIMTDPTDVSTFVEIDSKTLTTSYEKYEFILSGNGNYVAFMLEAPTSGTVGAYIDDITIDEAPSCMKPTNLEVVGDAQTALLSWSSGASEWEVAHYTDATANPADHIEGTATTTSYEINNLAIDADHYFWVRAKCSDTDFSAWTEPVSVHIGYCIPTPSSVDGNGISNVTFGVGSNVVNNDTPKATYADYSTQIGAVQAGVETTVAITYATGYTYGTIIWVDLNNSLSFEDNEIVYMGTSEKTNPTTLNATITIPATQALGDYRMRIGGSDSGFDAYISNPSSAAPSACYTGNWSCFQDYTLRLLEAPSCLTPTGLSVTTDGATATASWNGTAATYNIDVNGTVTEGVTSPYTFNVELSTPYTVMVQANCSASDVSDWSSAFDFTTPSCVGGHAIEYTLTDSYSDGWNGAAILVSDGNNVVETLTVANNTASNSGTLELCGSYYEFIWQSGQYDGECSWSFSENGTTLSSGKGSNFTGDQVIFTIGTPPSCAKPTSLAVGTIDAHSAELSWTDNGETAWQICINGDEANLVDADSNPYTLTGLDADTDYTVKVRAYCDAVNQSFWSDAVSFTTAESVYKPTNLQVADITTTSATLSWDGTSSDYVLQYRPWSPAGDDIITTGTMTTYTYDLSAFSGTGSFAIRHYDVTDMFQLIVDNIEVRNAGGDVVFSENFESCGGNMPAAFTNMDLDGDGYEWEIASSATSNVDGSYGIVSASYDNTAGALTPDNWLIISGIEMGGSISFSARGQDPSFAAENFAVYISTENSIVEVPLTTTSYSVTGLTPNTPYAWQVKSIDGADESKYASSFFKTKDDLLIFAVSGDWNDADNWQTVDGDPAAVPTYENNVRIDADANIPAGVVAKAKKASIGTGSVTIQDGGQLKQSSATLRVTMLKETTADVNNLIASPFSGRTLYSSSGTFSYFDNALVGDYDLYAFDPSMSTEWVNYEAAPTHISFEAANGLAGLMQEEGYFYANAEDKTLLFEGTTGPSHNGTIDETFDFDGTSTDYFNGWKLVGNPFTCTGYITYSEDATFYKLNAAGDGFEVYEGGMELAPGEGGFIQVAASGTITFSSDDPGVTINLTGTADLPLLPLPGFAINQSAKPAVAITLDNDATDNEATLSGLLGMRANVTLGNRTLYKDGSWNTLTLPFELTIAGSPLDGATAKTLTDAEVNGTSTSLTFGGAVEKMEAGVPYLIKWANASHITEPTFNNVVISDTDGGTISLAGDKVKFIGYYDAFGITAADTDIYYMTENNELKHTGVDRTLKACRAYFQFDSTTARSFVLNFGDDDVPTNISNLSEDLFGEGDWYTIDGLKVGDTPVKKGVYIKNGKKVVIK